VKRMLTGTFRHLTGYGPSKEIALWRSGVISWDDLESKLPKQLSLFPNPEAERLDATLDASKKALKEADAEFFASKLPRQEHYRIALTFPERTLLLDIETTGLSRYYDTITLIGWSLNGAYGVHVKGDDESALRDAFSQAKVIVTFNGSLFDLPFLSQELPDLPIPTAHVDLRFFARRVGLAGGQKVIEELLGLKRPMDLENIKGESAPVLWHKYRRGDLESLKLLISYNHADIEGMKFIFDTVTERLLKNEGIPQALRSVHRFSSAPSKLKLASSNCKRHPKATILLKPYQGRKGPKISLEDLSFREDFSKIRIVGIDLVGAEQRYSGWCLIDGRRVHTQRIASDDDLIRTSLAAAPALISIDSPLSLPVGRTRVTDDDPGRKTFGIMRECERTLKKRGINVYPSLIPSMQRLTERGIRLANRFREMGMPVIESYPGAAQDIIDIPRKRASLDLLEKGLVEFGVHGEFASKRVSHDELDAITSAIVGLFFWSGKFEALGNLEEEYLIIPDLGTEPTNWRSRKIIGISGTNPTLRAVAIRMLESLSIWIGRLTSSNRAIYVADREASYSQIPIKESSDVPLEANSRSFKHSIAQKAPSQAAFLLSEPGDHAFLAESFGPAYMHVHLCQEADPSKASSDPCFLGDLAHIAVSDSEDLHSIMSSFLAMPVEGEHKCLSQ
jgi:uncharacterized protein YprB with RNaseH-like and TPR domain/predicted nuclease with RNAse H fold